MVTSFQMNLPGQIIFGRGKFTSLPELAAGFGKKVMVLTGARSFQQSPFYQPFIMGLETLGLDFEVIGISGEPSPMLIDGITTKYRRKEIEVVIAVGGGSVIDTGKAVSAMLTVNNSVFEYLEGIGSGKKHSGHKLPFIAVPTTAGTGSEATKNAVLSDINREGFKKSLRHDSFIPEIALVDPDLTLSCPANVTAACGLDAYTQLLESYVSTHSNALTDALAMSGLRKISTSLPRIMENPSDVDARVDLSYGSLLSGITLANAGLGVVHGLASSVGGYFDIPHGIVCGTLLSNAVRTNIMKLQNEDPDNPALNKYSEAGKLFMDEQNGNAEHYLTILINKLEEWTQSFKIPKLSDYGIRSSDIPKIMERSGLKQNPVDLNEDDLINILSDRI